MTHFCLPVEKTMGVIGCLQQGKGHAFALWFDEVGKTIYHYDPSTKRATRTIRNFLHHAYYEYTFVTVSREQQVQRHTKDGLCFFWCMLYIAARSQGQSHTEAIEGLSYERLLGLLFRGYCAQKMVNE